MKTLELVPHNNQKSFNNRALVHIVGDTYYLQSYNTIVCSYSVNNGFLKYWDGWSSTTSRHVDSFRHLFNLGSLSKKEWLSLEAEKYFNNNLIVWHDMEEKTYNDYLLRFSRVATDGIIGG